MPKTLYSQCRPHWFSARLSNVFSALLPGPGQRAGWGLEVSELSWLATLGPKCMVSSFSFLIFFLNWVIILLFYLHNSVTDIFIELCNYHHRDRDFGGRLHPARRTLSLQPGIEPVSPILEELSLVLAAGPPGKSLYGFFLMPRPTFRQEWSGGGSWRSGGCRPLPGMSQASVILWGGGWGGHSGLSLSLFPSPP